MLEFLTQPFPAAWRLPLRGWTNDAVKWLLLEHGDAFRGLTDALLQLLIRVERFLTGLPWWLVVLLVALLVFHASGRSWVTAALLAGLMLLVGASACGRRR
jgi:glycine betaine/proline transport system permease protein